MMDLYILSTFIGTFDALAKKGKLTEADLRKAWEDQRALGITERSGVSSDDVPYDLGDFYAHYMIRPSVVGCLRRRDLSLTFELPLVVKWIVRESDTDPFATVSMDHAAFIREILNDPVFGPRVRFEVARNPQLLRFLPDEERWEILTLALFDYGKVVSWYWPWYTAELWSKERTVALIRDLIKDPEIAGAFLANSWAHAGWLAFATLKEFLEVVGEAAQLAPFEAHLNRRWIATMIGDLKSGQERFMIEKPYWSNAKDSFQDQFAPQGEDETRELLSHTAGAALALALKDEGRPLSACSKALVRRIRELPTILTRSSDAERIARVLLDIPDCELGHDLLDRILLDSTEENIAWRFRWLLSVEWRFSRDIFLIMGDKEGPMKRDYHLEERLKTSWFGRAMRAAMEARGWRFRTVQTRHNERKGKDEHVMIPRDDSIRVYVFPDHSTQEGDLYTVRQEVMLPPTEPRIDPFYYGEDFVLYRAGNHFPLATQVTDYMRKWCDR